MSSTDDFRTIPEVSINIHSSTTFHGFKRIELAKRSKPKRKLKFNGQHFTLTPVKDCDEEMHFLKIITKNDQKRIHVYPSMKSKKKYRKRKDKKKLRQQYSIPFLSIDEDDDYESEDEEMTEERRKCIQEKVINGKFLFTKKEEKDIHERAEEYCRSVTADIYHFVKPGGSELCCPEPCFIVNVDGSVKEFPQPAKRKKGSYLTDSCYIKSHDFLDPYDNTKMLPTGTRLLRPTRKLVEIVAKVLHDSPDGLLQVPQIYAALQNKYPYYRYMDKPSISSWRSSIRHALYQKWFRKIKFSVSQIRCKGSYWALNTDVDPPTFRPPSNERSSQSTKDIESATEEHSLVPKRKRRSKKKKNEGNMCRLQFKPNGELLEMKEDTKEGWNHNVTNSLEALLKVAKQYGLKISLTATPVTEESDVRQSPVHRCDPILSSWPSSHLNATGGPVNSFCESDPKYANYSSAAIDNRDFEKDFVSNPLLHNISPCFSSINSCCNEASSSRCDYSTMIPSFSPCSSLKQMHLSKKNQSHTQEMLGNMKTIFTDSETLYVSKNEDTTDSYIDERFSLQDLEEVEENSESEELFNAVNSICDNIDDHDHSRLLEGDILRGGHTLPEFCSIPQSSGSEDRKLSPFPNSGNDLTQDSSLDDFLNSVLKMGGNLGDTPFDEEQVVDDSLFDFSLINEDSFFQNCQLFDELDS